MTRLSKWLIDIAAVVVIVLGLRVAAPMITQFLVILFLAIIISPAYYFLRKWRVPSWLALTLVITSVGVACLYGTSVVLSRAVLDFTKKIPAYHAQLVKSIGELGQWLAQQEIDLPPTLFDSILKVDASVLSQIVKQAGSMVGSFVSSAVLVLIIVAFILCELPSLPDKVRNQHWMTESLWDRLTRIVLDVRHYMSIKTTISVATGGVIYLGLLAMGIDSPLLFGTTTFILNYLPMIGSIIAAVPPVLIAAMQFGTLKGVYVALLYLIVNVILGSIFEPRFMGSGFGVSPVLVLVALIFWGWVLGPIGMLFAVPLTMAVRSAIGSMMRESSTSSTNSGGSDR